MYYISIVGIITPTDFQFFQRGRYTTNQQCFQDGVCIGTVHFLLVEDGGLLYGGCLKWGYPNSWMVYFMENPRIEENGW